MSLTASAGVFSKTPSKEILSKKIGIWTPALAEPESRSYTLQEFVDHAFRNVTSKSWEKTDDSWILIVNIKDPMTKKKSIFKMQFLNSDNVAGPRRIVMDSEDYPMRMASNIMHPLLSNVVEKLGVREEKAKQKENTSLDRFIGKYCGNAKFEINKISKDEITISADNKYCNFENKTFKRIEESDKKFSIEINSKCKIFIEDRGIEKLNRISLNINSICSGSPTELNKCDPGGAFTGVVPCD